MHALWRNITQKHHLDCVFKKKHPNVDNHRALLSCFGWLYAQASHLGFTPMTELTYPLATQVCAKDQCIKGLNSKCIQDYVPIFFLLKNLTNFCKACFTDGRVFTNYWYQLNSCDLRHHNTDPNTKNNVLWVGEDKVKVYIFLSSHFSSIFCRFSSRKWRMENWLILTHQP